MSGDPRDDPDRFGTVAFYAALGRAFVIMCAVIPVLFVIELLDKATDHALDRNGEIVPHHLGGLDGIVLAPLLHASFTHLYGNAVPLLLTGTFVLAGGVKRFLLVTAFVAVVSGAGVWFFGSGPTVGASGVIFGYLGYLFMRGLVERSAWNLAVALLIGLLYGYTVSGVIPSDPHISWQAHAFGMAGGVVAAVLFRRRRPAPPAQPTFDFTVPEPTLDLPPTP